MHLVALKATECTQAKVIIKNIPISHKSKQNKSALQIQIKYLPNSYNVI